jgi:autotransporter-associated beta strand protein
MKPKSLLWLAMITPIAAAPARSQLRLVNEAGFNQINVTVDPGSGLADTDVTTLSGTVDAQFDIDPLASTISQLTLSNGRATGTNMNFSRSTIFGGYNINATDLSSTLYTIVPPGTVNPVDGLFAANQHRFDIDQGNITGSTNGLIGNNTINEVMSPANPIAGNGSGTGAVVLTSLGDSGNFRIYNSVVTLPVTLADTFLVGSTNVNLTGNGTLKFSGTVQVPTTATVADTVWNGSVSQDWNNPFNWSNGVPQENAPQWSAVINTAAGNFPSITSAGTYQSDWDIVVGGGTNGRLDQSAGTVATGAGNWFFLGWQGAQGTYNQTGSGSLRVGGVANPTGNMLIGLDNGTVSTWNVNTTGSTLAGGIFAGCNGAATGIINMSAGTVEASGDVQIGGSFFNNGGTGELNMTGGVMTANIVAFARGGNNVAAVSGTGVISGGTLNSRQWFTLGFAGGSGNIANLTNNGGTINVNTVGGGVMEMGVFDATTNLFTQDSGSLNLQNNASISFGQGGNHTGASTFTQNGGSVTFFSDAGSTVGGTGSLILGNGGSIGSYAYNLNGGTLTTPSITRTAPGANGSFTFNGGTLRPTGSTATFMQGLSTASIQIGGANIDTNGNDITIAQALLDSGGGGLTKLGAGTLTLAGVNSYAGDTTVQSGGQLNLADNAQIRFVVGIVGENTRLTGTGTVQLDGDFNIDVTGADGTVGNSWSLVNVGTLAETYGSTFTVAGWTETSAGVWLSPQGGYRFTESSGILDVINVNPFIVQQPASIAAQEGSTASLVVVATGNGNLTYRWFKDGNPIPGEVGSTLNIVNVDSGDQGSYTVEITDDREPGLVTMSSAAIVSVFPAWSGLVSHDPFANSGSYAIGELSAQNPTINGYVGAWTEIDFGDSQPAVSAGSLAYGNPSYLGSTGGKVTVQSDINGGEITFANSGRVFRQLSPQLVVGDSTTGVRYLSFLFQSGQETGTTIYQTLALYNANTADASRNFDIGLTTNGGSSGSEYNFGVDGGYSNTGVAANSGVRLMVVKFNLSSAPFSDSVTVWVDPVLGSGEPVGGTTVDFVDLNWDRLAFSDYDGNSAAWDEIRWGSSFDSVTLNPNPANTYASWISGYPAVGALSGFNDDADRDGIVNGIENLFGTNPTQSSQGIVQVARSGNTVTFQHPENASPAADVTADYVWSTDLVSFHANGATAGGISVNFADSANTPVAGTTTVTATVTGTMPAKLFISLKATLPTP